jgi:hypothetical protein
MGIRIFLTDGRRLDEAPYFASDEAVRAERERQRRRAPPILTIPSEDAQIASLIDRLLASAGPRPVNLEGVGAPPGTVALADVGAPQEVPDDGVLGLSEGEQEAVRKTIALAEQYRFRSW